MPKLSKQTFEKPREDFPLFPHQSGRWCKKIKGAFHYFGKCADDPLGEAALLRWLDEKDAIYAGRKPRAKKDDSISVADLCNEYLHAKKQQVNEGTLSQRHWHDMSRASERVIEVFGRNRSVTDLRADDFVTLRAKLAKTLGVVSIGNEVQRIRSIFKYGYDAELIPAPVRFGPTFKRSGKKLQRAARRARGERLFTAAEVKALIEKAGVPLKAMILLGINCAMGQSDIATLPLSRLDFTASRHTYERPKTGVDRRCPLWPETMEAINAAIAKRPKPGPQTDAGLLFVTKYGEAWVRTRNDGKTWIDSVTQEFKKLLKECEISRTGASFYDLRRTFRTIADETKDQPAIMLVMGHAAESDDMGDVYRQKIDDARLKAVVDHVRLWVWPPEPKKKAAKKGVRSIVAKPGKAVKK